MILGDTLEVQVANYIAGGYTTFLRTEFHATILSRLANFPHCHTHTSKRLLSYVEIERNGVPEITLDFSDGTTATCDVLIGADGLRSPVRCSMYESLAHHAELVGCKCRNDEDKDRGEALKSLQRPKWSGVLVYRALVPTKELLNVNTDHPVASRVMQYFGRNQVSYGIVQSRVYWPYKDGFIERSSISIAHNIISRVFEPFHQYGHIYGGLHPRIHVLS